MASVLSEPRPPSFTWIFTCRACRARITAELADLRFGHSGYGWPQDDRDFVTCPYCLRRVEPFLRVTVDPQAGVTQNPSGRADHGQP